MGPFGGAGVELLGIALFGVIALVIWVFNKGRESAAAEPADLIPTARQPRTPIEHFQRDCSACGSTFELSGRLTLEFSEERYSDWHAHHVCHPLDTSPRHNKSSTPGRADG